MRNAIKTEYSIHEHSLLLYLFGSLVSLSYINSQYKFLSHRSLTLLLNVLKLLDLRDSKSDFKT